MSEIEDIVAEAEESKWQIEKEISKDNPVKDVERLMDMKSKDYVKFLEQLVQFLEQDLESREELIWDYEQELDRRKKSGQTTKEILTILENHIDAFNERENASILVRQHMKKIKEW